MEKSESAQNAEILCVKHEELKQLCESYMHGHMTRSRVQNLSFYEKPTKEFCNLEKFKFIEKTIKKIMLNDGRVIINQTEILEQIRLFYACLYKNIRIDPNDISEWDWNSINQKQNKLTPDEALNIEGPLTIKEIGSAIRGMKHNKTPGIDSFPAKFYKMFWAKLNFFVLRA